MADGVELQITGIVQGVGFRPFIYRLAQKYGYTGHVVNTGSGVSIHIDRTDDHLNEFLRDINRQSPPLARIDAIERHRVPSGAGGRFFILASRSSEKNAVSIPPDIALCPDCRRELSDRADRRYLYPFINCTNCGPRFSIIEGLPYDRPSTSMRRFSMCPECEAEYRDPGNRRFHAQPNSCWQCGPVLSWHHDDSGLIDCPDPVAEAARALAGGKLVAVRGIGGFHFTADAFAGEAVRKVRRAKGRRSKPLAVMFADIEAVKRNCHLSPVEKRLLESHRRPIVLLGKKDDCSLAEGIAPGLDEVGAMLPYSPVHHLLFTCPGISEALVMTSANFSGEPICAASSEAFGQLSGVADHFLVHNREIVNPLDDSVVRVVAERPRLIRRSRGYVPQPINLGRAYPDTLACGGESKNTFCFLKNDKAFISQHMGTLSNPGVFKRYQESISSFAHLLDVEPEIVACDLHPDYPSSRQARGHDLPLFAVQHHHAHAAAVMAEHNLSGKCLAVIMDGAGLGPDHTVWGGEILLTDYMGYSRLACLQCLPMPGGDLAARELYRMGFAAWWASRDRHDLDTVPESLQGLPEKDRNILAQMIDRGVNTPWTSSCGRLFDGVVSLLDLRQKSDYEGQSGMELEAMAYQALGKRTLCSGDLAGADLLPVVLDDSANPAVICSTPMIRELLVLLKDGYEISGLALAFHKWLIASITAAVSRIIDDQGEKAVILGGGCLQNTLLLAGLEISLMNRGYAVYSAEDQPANDGCIALGQAVIAGTLYMNQS